MGQQAGLTTRYAVAARQKGAGRAFQTNLAQAKYGVVGHKDPGENRHCNAEKSPTGAFGLDWILAVSSTMGNTAYTFCVKLVH
jgi:hypothetical protein